MKKLISILAFAALGWPGLVHAQTATPNTTLCAAQTQAATTVCLTSTTSIVNQVGIYVDQEYELVQLPANTTVCTGPCYVPVSRNNRAAGSGPTLHLNNSVAWLQLTPSQTVVPGSSGFSLSTNMTDIGPCTRSAQVYLPHIFVNRGIKRDCNSVSGTANAAVGEWVDYAPESGLDFPSPTPLQAVPASGALSVSSGSYLITKAGVAALTLAAPTAGVQDGMVIKVTSGTANAHTITATSLFYNGGSGVPYTTATFTAYAGAEIVLKAYNGYWYVVSTVNVTLS